MKKKISLADQKMKDLEKQEKKLKDEMRRLKGLKPTELGSKGGKWRN
jgi:hypothetical protein